MTNHNFMSYDLSFFKLINGNIMLIYFTIKKIAFLFAFIFSLLLFLSIDFPDRELECIENVTGGGFCSSKYIFDSEDVFKLDDNKFINKKGINNYSFGYDAQKFREISIKNFDTDKYSCIEMSDKSRNYYIKKGINSYIKKNSGHIFIKSYKIPIIISRLSYSDNKNGVYNKIFVRVPGGPGGVDLFSETSQLFEFSSTTLFIDFFYTGNGFNIMYPENNFGVATDQLAIFLKNLRRRNPNAEIVLIGESMGGLISSSALENLNKRDQSKNIVNKLILLSPAFANLNDTAITLSGIVNKTVGDKYSWYRVRKMGAESVKYGKIIKLNMVAVFNNFYSKDDGEIELFDRIKNIDKIPILIVYGSQDDRIGISHVDKFFRKKIPNVEIMRVDGMKHQFNPFTEADDIRSEISAFLGY